MNSYMITVFFQSREKNILDFTYDNYIIYLAILINLTAGLLQIKVSTCLVWKTHPLLLHQLYKTLSLPLHFSWQSYSGKQAQLIYYYIL